MAVATTKLYVRVVVADVITKEGFKVKAAVMVLVSERIHTWGLNYALGLLVTVAVAAKAPKGRIERAARAMEASASLRLLMLKKPMGE